MASSLDKDRWASCPSLTRPCPSRIDSKTDWRRLIRKAIPVSLKERLDTLWAHVHVMDITSEVHLMCHLTIVCLWARTQQFKMWSLSFVRPKDDHRLATIFDLHQWLASLKQGSMYLSLLPLSDLWLTIAHHTRISSLICNHLFQVTMIMNVVKCHSPVITYSEWNNWLNEVLSA